MASLRTPTNLPDYRPRSSRCTFSIALGIAGTTLETGAHRREVRMATIPMYHDGSRQWQDRFSTRKLADRLAEKLARNAFTDEDRAFIASRPMFFLATADAQGHPDCSYKGGVPGFLRVIDASTLAFPS